MTARPPEHRLASRNVSVAWLTIVVAISGLGTGCDSGPKLYPTTGVVTFNDKPLPNAGVIFGPAAPSSGSLATGRTDANGNFSLNTDQRPGVIAAKYTATVSATEEQAGAQNDMLMLMLKPNETQPGQQPPFLPGPPKMLIPEKYFKPQESGLSFTVSASSKNHFEIKLTGEPPK